MFVPSLSKLRRLTLVAPLLAFVLAASQLGGAVHDATVQHAICAEHGEAIDVPGTVTGLPTTRDTLASATTTHGHEHCSFRARLATRPALVRVTYVLESARNLAEPWARGAPAPQIAILHLAPKSSPPSSAVLS